MRHAGQVFAAEDSGRDVAINGDPCRRMAGTRRVTGSKEVRQELGLFHLECPRTEGTTAAQYPGEHRKRLWREAAMEDGNKTVGDYDEAEKIAKEMKVIRAFFGFLLRHPDRMNRSTFP